MNEHKRYSGTVRPTARLISIVMKSSFTLVMPLLLINLLFGFLPFVVALTWQNILATLQLENGQLDMTQLFIMLAIVGGISLSYGSFFEIAETVLRNKLSLRMQRIVHSKASELPISYYETPKLADMMDRAGKVFCYGEAIAIVLYIFGAVRLGISLISIAVLIWVFEPTLTLASVVLILSVLIKFKLNRVLIDMLIKLQPLHRAAGVFRKYFSTRTHIKEMRLMATEDFFINKWKGDYGQVLLEEKTLSKKAAWFRFFSDFMEKGTIIGAYVMCIYFVTLNRLSVAEFGAIIFLTGQFTRNLAGFIEEVDRLDLTMLSIRTAMDYFDLASDKRESSFSNVDCLTFDGVSYSYPETSSFAVKDINIDVKLGETVAIVGLNGSGKTTLAKLALGFLNPTVGKTKIGSVLMKDIPYSILHKSATSMFQDYVRFYVSVKDNIVISDSERSFTDDEIYQLLSKLGIDFIRDNENVKLDTDLGVEYGGVDLSGGQWQQLAIARAALRNTDIVVLDEPTSALDPLREEELISKFSDMCKDKIGIIITHRMSMCQIADNILVMDNGNILEYGTHRELIAKKGTYARMYASQQEMYSE